MSDLIRNVKDIGDSDRQALEHMLGEHPREDQQLVIRGMTFEDERQLHETTPCDVATNSPALPEWYNVHEGRSYDEVADLEQTVLTRADLSRPSE